MKDSKRDKIIKGAIILIILVVIIVAAINAFAPTYSHINILGVSMEVPDGSFGTPSEYKVYSIYTGKHNEWSVEGLNVNNADLNNSKHKDIIDAFDTDKDTVTLFGDKYTVDGIDLYESDDNKVVSFFKVGDVDFKVFGDEGTALGIIKSIKDQNKNSNLVFS